MVKDIGFFVATGFAACAIALGLSIAPARAEANDCAAPARVEAPSETSLAPLDRVEDYRSVLKSCRAADGRSRLAIRAMRVDGQDLLLTVDPQRLTSEVVRAACWTCAETDDEAQKSTRFIAAVERQAEAPGKLGAGAVYFDNAGLVHGQGAGSFVTGDLCPSRKPLDRDFLEKLAAAGPHTPVALSISGLWMLRHAEDFHWLREQKRKGALDISFVNHSFRHPYYPDRPDAENYLLAPGFDMDKEIFDVERLLIANGETPSVFFRFPGLISDKALMQTVRRARLIPLGADSWLVFAPPLRPGAIILVHPNGNEPAGLGHFAHLWEKGALPMPFRPINEAP